MPMEPAPEYRRSMVPSARTLVPQILVAGVLPLIGYALLRPHVTSDWVALAIVMIFPAGEIIPRTRTDPTDHQKNTDQASGKKRPASRTEAQMSDCR
jgi:hypothetical protein